MSRLENQVDDVSPRERGVTKPPLSPDVARFCIQNNLDEDLQNAICLANSTFAGASGLTAELEVDPDTDEERIILHLAVNAPIEDVVKSRHAFTRRWVDSASPAVRQKIVLLYHIVN